ncbi:hypothetical protein L226DRAFT_609827 [Lentinus tigrinus ALCF2SS1-7]|uniref:C2H2-type domain-containing protein n=1 Tax=Lentinus tigrinus ALCF2SS1-6 TaxID=1328759 RepID=A0A5C2SVG4_9APHY|nr:hypothetical protein L227DRAFT_630689 [Lentinus tigrinus ALCF2SS1-6]RPD79347.1 hypothetical protein L226DRAFT_609827 [Lentinus tigrinus ALCF2SS1-7]
MSMFRPQLRSLPLWPGREPSPPPATIDPRVFLQDPQSITPELPNSTSRKRRHGKMPAPANTKRPRMALEIAKKLAGKGRVDSCPLCNKKLSKLSPLDAKAHFLNDHYDASEKRKNPGNKSCKWPGCGFIDISWNNVLRHIGRHFVETHRCPECQKKFSRPDAWTRHCQSGACGRAKDKATKSRKGP